MAEFSAKDIVPYIIPGAAVLGGIGVTAAGGGIVGVPLIAGGVAGITKQALTDSGNLPQEVRFAPPSVEPAPAVREAIVSKNTSVAIGYRETDGRWIQGWVPADRVNGLTAMPRVIYVAIKPFRQAPLWQPADVPYDGEYSLVSREGSLPESPPPAGQSTILPVVR